MNIIIINNNFFRKSKFYYYAMKTNTTTSSSSLDDLEKELKGGIKKLHKDAAEYHKANQIGRWCYDRFFL